MPGNEPKAQHFVQRAYLEGFCDPVPSNGKTPLLWVHSAHRPVRRQVPKECAVENYFYCFEQDGERNFSAEAHLSSLENASRQVLDASGRGILPITLRDRFTLTGYVAMALVRTPQGKSYIDRAAVDHAAKTIRDLLADPVRHAKFCRELETETGQKCDPEEQKRILKSGQICGSQTNRAWSLQMMIEMLMYFQELFMGMYLALLHANDSFFLTCDCPVRVHEPTSVLSGDHPVEMLFPLNREFCLVGSTVKGEERLELASPDVQVINASIIRQADRFVYAPFNVPYIQDELREPRIAKVGARSDAAVTF